MTTATVEDYDKMGRSQHYWQCTPLNCGSASIWAASYNYDVAGDVTSWNHPAGFTITNTISAARRITQIASSWNDSTHPGTLAQNILYTAARDVTGLQNGCVGSGCTPVQETYTYNNRLQEVMVELGTAGNPAADSCRVYNYYALSSNPTNCAVPTQGTNNNGNVAGYFYNDSATPSLSHSASYYYDAVNRLVSAAATGNATYSQTFTYTGDGSNGAFGNMSCAPSGPACVTFTYSASSNRITSSGYSYDAAGNLTGDGTHAYQWDAEAHLTVAYLSGTAVQTNTYNALGQRVRDVTQTNTTDEAYGADGSLLWRYTGNSSDPNQRAFVPFSGGILAEYYGGSPGGTIFDHPDELGSITAGTSYNGSVCQERLFLPFGEAWTGAGSCGMHQVFSKLPDYDAETDQYNTLHRHYSPSGRWLSPDPGGLKVVRLDDPQTWNMYAYVRNNPTTLTDPSGLEPDPPKGQTAPHPTGTCALMGMCNDKNNGVDKDAITNPSWKSLSDAQKSVLEGGKDTWDDMSATARANFAAITHALQDVKLGDGKTGLSEIKAGSAKMKEDGTEMKVSWQKGAKEAFESHGFSGRPGAHLGTNLGPTGQGETHLHLVFGIDFLGIHTESQIHIDYRAPGEGHFGATNDDVTAPSETVHGRVINNYERYKAWYP